MKFLFCKNIMKTRPHMRERRSIPKYLIITTFQRIKILTQERTRYFFFSFLLLFFCGEAMTRRNAIQTDNKIFFLIFTRCVFEFLRQVCIL